MTTSADVLAAFQVALQGSTDAGFRVYSPGDWPSGEATLPLIKLKNPDENREAIGRSGAPQFTTTTTIRVLGEVQATATTDDAGAGAAEAAIIALKRQIEVAVVNSYPLTGMLQKIASIRAQYSFNANSAVHLAAVQMDFACEFYEGPENFAAIQTSIPSDVVLTPLNFPPLSADITLTP